MVLALSSSAEQRDASLLRILLDVDTDQRWSKHPKARPDRAYGSLVSVPVTVRDKVIGVLNVISTYNDAFSHADRTYIELLGSILSVAWSLVDEENGDG